MPVGPVHACPTYKCFAKIHEIYMQQCYSILKDEKGYLL